MNAPAATLLYDEDCGFCKWSLDKILAWDRRATIRPLAIQSEEGDHMLASVPVERRLDSFHLVTDSGEVRSAGAAVPELAGLLPGGRALAAVFRAFPHLTARAYRFVAANRNRFGRWLGIDASCELRR